MRNFNNSDLLAHLLFALFQKNVAAEMQASKTYSTFTPHGASHILGVEESVNSLLKLHETFSKAAIPLSRMEKLLLRFCSWGHDLGMIESVANRYWDSLPEGKRSERKKDEILRKEHDKASAVYIRQSLHNSLLAVVNDLKESSESSTSTSTECLKKYSSLLKKALPDLKAPLADYFLHLLWVDIGFATRMFADASTLAATVNLIARYHRRAVEIDDCPDQRHLFGDVVRTKLLAAIFRLGDALHIDRTRFEREPYEIFRALPEFREENRVHWIKSFILSSIQIEPSDHAIHLQADLPIGTSNSNLKNNETLTRLREMLNFIITDLEEDVLSVSKILVHHGFPLLLGVKCEVHEIPAMEYTDDIRAALDSIYAASSPNTSQLITIALGGLKARLIEA